MNEFLELKEGDSGEAVILLQQLMKINNFYPSTVTGSFGPETTNYLLSFQNKYHLTPTATSTDETWQKLNDLTYSSTNYALVNKPVIKINDQNDYVKEAQTILKDLMYYEGEITGYFDQSFKDAVESYQYVNKLVPDGVIGTYTWSSLINLYSPLSNCNDTTTPSNTYTVKAGDTLYSIANKYNISVNDLMTYNNLSSTVLSINQVLKIPTTTTETPDSSVTYTVKSGDTLYSIANKYNISVNDLISYNNLSSTVLSINQVLKIPTTTQETPETNTYTVKSGDTLYSIANKYNISVNDIINLNNLSSTVLSINQVLKIPSQTTSKTYTVKAGDTLYSIAIKNNTTVDSIIAKNNLTNTTLSINQILQI